ncbi:MAG TPA: hypothetical protein PK252_12195 [Bacteroidales bacterium]|nr:hypothetical protein [Bacteroidales bacterium]
MMKLKIWLCLLPVIFYSINFLGQGKKKVSITTAIEVQNEDGEGLSGVSAKLFNKGQEEKSVVTTNSGIVTFTLEPNSDYLIELSKDGFVSKIISVNTKVPSYEDQQFEVAFPVLLFQPCEGLDYSILQKPVVKLVHNEKKRDFLPEKVYDEVMQEKLSKLYEDNQNCLDEKYNAIVREGDRLFKSKKYEEAVSPYQKALGIRPNDKYVKSQLDAIDKLLAESKDKEATYKKYIEQADKQMADKNYPLAKEFYNKSLGVKPGSAYPTSQIAEIDKILAQQKQDETNKQQLQQQVTSLVAQGDGSDDYCGAVLKAYKDALALKPNDPAILAKISAAEKKCNDIKAAIANDKKKQEQYKASIAKADSLYKANKYDAAIAEYQNASKIIPAEKYPKDQVDLINDIVKKQSKDRDAQFKALVAQGDKSEDYCGTVQNSYREALKLKPNDPELLTKISIAEKKCNDANAQQADLKKRQAGYKASVAKADSLYKANKYDAAIAEYQNAMKFVPSEKYPQDQIDLINEMVRKQMKDAESQYKSLIKEADKAFDNERFDFAKDSYLKASKIKPNEAYPNDKIKEIDNIITAQKVAEAKRKEIEEKYKQKIAEADAAMKNNNYMMAKNLYNEALTIKLEKYPSDRIEEIDQLMKAQADKAEKEYQSKVKSADKNFVDSKLKEALADYQAALAMKPNETYPQQRIDAINKMLEEKAKKEAEEKAKKDAYASAIARADKLLAENNFDQAAAAYKEASSYQPSEQYPYAKIDEIAKLKKQKETEASYAKAIITGDDYFNKKQLQQAKSFYNQALGFKPGDKSATDKIANVDRLINEDIKRLADEKARKDAYDKAIIDADKSLALKDYDMAKASYQTALSIDANQAYPRQKIAEVDKLIKEKEINDNYQSALDEAQKLFDAKSFDMAKTKYREAKKIKPSETFPDTKVKEIEAAQAQMEKDRLQKEKKEKDYKASVQLAESLFENARYDEAQKEYEKALLILPDEVYPKQKIAKIKEIKMLLEKEAKASKTAAAPAPKKAEPVKGKLDKLVFANESERAQFLSDLLTSYPPGITHEVYKDKIKTVNRYIIIRDNQANDFRSIRLSYGMEYYKNDKPITEQYFNSQVKVRAGEYYNKVDL